MQGQEFCGFWPHPRQSYIRLHTRLCSWDTICEAVKLQSQTVCETLLVHHRGSQKCFCSVPMHSIWAWHPDISCWNQSRHPEWGLGQKSLAQAHAKLGQSCNSQMCNILFSLTQQACRAGIITSLFARHHSLRAAQATSKNSRSLETTGKKKEPNTHLFVQTPSPMLPLNCSWS